jgi:hypothetical protein
VNTAAYFIVNMTIATALYFGIRWLVRATPRLHQECLAGLTPGLGAITNLTVIKTSITLA